MLVRLSRCCSPVPGDEIIGFITKGRGISVHRTDCPNILNLPAEEEVRLISVKWDESQSKSTYNADIYIIANDRKGLFSDIARACSDMDVNIAGVNIKTTEENMAYITMTLLVTHVTETAKILRTLGQIESVIEINRTRG
jgi:GTP pyrophosphokinase